MTNIRLPDPLSQPGAPGFTSAKLLDNNPIYRERLPGGKIITLESAAQYWGVTLSYEELLPDEYDTILAAILESKSTGKFFSVLLPHKENYNVKGDPSNTIIMAGQEGNRLDISAFNLTGIPKKGDLIKLTNHCSKVYQIISASKTGSTLSLLLYPNLMKKTLGNEKPIFNNVLFQLALESPDKWDSTFSSEGTYNSFQLELAEAITYD